MKRKRRAVVAFSYIVLIMIAPDFGIFPLVYAFMIATKAAGRRLFNII